MSTRSKPAPGNLRIGLKWRDGRPRWEPSPANRAVGIKGRDLKTLDGKWISDRGLAISLCDARSDWAAAIRDAMTEGPRGLEARQDLRFIVSQVTSPATDAERLRHRVLADLIEKANALLEARPEDLSVLSGDRTVDDLIAAFFTNPTAISSTTLTNYRTQAKKLSAAWGTKPVASITNGMAYKLYQEWCGLHSLGTANMAMGAAGSMFRWAVREDWISHSPIERLGRQKPEGRLVFWPFELEKAFVAWCDDRGYHDVADAVVMGNWMGTRQIDSCVATLGDLAGDEWLFTPIKTARKSIQACPGILPPMRARIDARRNRLASDGFPYLRTSDAPFLFNPITGRAHTSASIGKRFRQARNEAINHLRKGHKALSGIDGVRLQDTRDTCVTRLYEAGVPLDEIPSWTGHGPHSAESVLRAHYLVLKRKGAKAQADKLWASAKAAGFTLD